MTTAATTPSDPDYIVGELVDVPHGIGGYIRGTVTANSAETYTVRRTDNGATLTVSRRLAAHYVNA